MSIYLLIINKYWIPTTGLRHIIRDCVLLLDLCDNLKDRLIPDPEF